MNTAISQQTIDAYQQADYHVNAAPPFSMHIGQRCEELGALFAAHGSGSCAFISACNPMGEPTDAEINASRQKVFSRMLEQRGLAYLEGEGRDPKGEWEPEPSLLLFGIAQEDAMALGYSLKQNAIVWCGADLVPQLVLLR